MASNPAGNDDGRSAPPDLLIRRRRLPHWEFAVSTYFVTFRLADSLPRSVLREISLKYAEILGGKKWRYRNLTSEQRQKLARLFWGSMEKQLDTGAGACHFRQPEIARIMASALKHFDAQRYELFAWCIMPNHVHVLFCPYRGQSLAKIVHSWKSFTANQANRLRGARGKFWQREYYDHIVRNEKEFQRIVNYIVTNPMKAGLEDWPWVYVGKS